MTAPEAAYVAALASLPDVGPARLRALLGRGPAAEVLAAVVEDRVVADLELAAACGRRDPSPLLRRWAEVARSLDVEELWRRHLDAGVAVLVPGAPGWPQVFDVDPDPPAVLFALGDLAVLARAPERPAVAVVGTRNCTRYGWDVAHRLGLELAGAGVAVVSGLARGIDGAAHRGALDARRQAAAPPIAVVGTGPDVVYPRGSRGLWSEVAAAGVLVTEAPLGTPPARWRFPARNRLIAALADVVVVVESAAAGGALHTVDEALARDRLVFAVPGPLTSPASIGTNRLLLDVAQPLCEVDDVLAVVGAARTGGRPGPAAPPPADPVEAAVLESVGWTPTSLDQIVATTGLSLGEAAAAVARLDASRRLTADGPAGWVRTDGDAGVTQR